MPRSLGTLAFCALSLYYTACGDSADCAAEAEDLLLDGVAELEAEEEAEAAMMDVRLIQTKLSTQKVPLRSNVDQEVSPEAMAAASRKAALTLDHLVGDLSVTSSQDSLAAAPATSSQVVSSGSATAGVADSTEEAATDLATDLSIVTMDHNGKVCMLCSGPPAERIGKVRYEAFRTDCGSRSSPTGPSAADLTRPAVEFMQGGRDTNGFCELNFAKGCVDAIANRDYLYWAKSLNLEAGAMKQNAPWDARYCLKNGFLEPAVVRLQHNFTALQTVARELCQTKYAKYGIEKLSFVDMMSKARYDDRLAPSLEEAEELAAWNCAMGDLGCDMAMCAYSFCARTDGTLGLYGECDGWDPVDGMALPKPH